MQMVVQTKLVGIEIKLKIGHNQDYHPTRLIAILKVQKLGHQYLIIGQKALVIQVEDQQGVQSRGQVMLKVRETAQKRGQNAIVLQVVELLKEQNLGRLF